MKTDLRTLLYKAAHRLKLRKDPFPQIIALDVIPPYICRFEVTNRYESGRVKAANIEVEFISRLLATLTSSDVFFDIGAGIGLFSIYAATAARCQVISFEPDPETRARLLHNLALNKLAAFEMHAGTRQELNRPKAYSKSLTPALQVIDWGVSDTQSQATLFSDGIRGNSPSLSQVHGLQHSITIALNSLDQALTIGEIPYPTLIKIDIEGAEMQALHGMTGLLSSEKAPRLIFIELHPQFLPNFNTSTQEFYAFLAAHNYQEIVCAPRGAESHHVFERVR